MNRAMAWFLVLLAIALVLYYNGVIPAWAEADKFDEPYYQEFTLSENYSASLFACHVGVRSIRIISAEPRTLHGKTVLMIRADRNYDGGVDMEMFFDMPEGEPATFPHYYVYDSTFTGKPDIAYRDVNGNGVCQEMEQVPVKYIVQGEGEES